MFSLLERISDLRGNETAGRLKLPIPDAPRPALWVFVSTIGEVNAIRPFLDQLAERHADLQLVLITDHDHYHASYLGHYPQAVVCVSRGHASDAAALARHYPPRLLIVGEIPCLPHDAPCRFSFAFVLEAKRRGAPAAIVNGWLYHYQPSSRMDRIERHLFVRDYLRSFDLICVQLEETRQHLIVAGARPEQVEVTGNIKFDAMNRSDWKVEQARSPKMLASLLGAGRPIVVAGCVTDYPEQQLVLDAFVLLRERHPDAFLVLAPRHPEYTERMDKLREFLAERGIPSLFRSQSEDTALPAGLQCLVLDTMGDLRDFYAASTIAHVGVDHNLLEPLAFEKPITVCPGWEATYPSYPVFRLVQDLDLLMLCGDAREAGKHWIDCLTHGTNTDKAATRIHLALAAARGATQRNLALLARPGEKAPTINGEAPDILAERHAR